MPPQSAPPGPTSAPPGPPPASPVSVEPVSPGPVLHGEVVPGRASDPSGPAGGWGANYPQEPAFGPPHGSGQTYTGSGLTAADLVWSPRPEPGSGRIWKITAAVIGALALVAGLTVGGWYLFDSGSDPQPRPTASRGVSTAKDIQKSLGGTGFECTAAFTSPVTVDLCFRESPEYRESVGFQMLDATRASWARLWVWSNKPARYPVKQQALRTFGSVIDQALSRQDAEAAKTWLADMPEDYTKSDYLVHSVGAVSLKLLPNQKTWAVLYVQFTATDYQRLGEPALPQVTPRAMEKAYLANAFKCRPSTGGATCRDDQPAGEIEVSYQIRDGKVTSARLIARPNTHLAEVAPTARQQTAALLGLILTPDQVDAAHTWLERAFDGKAHHTVLSGIEVRVASGKAVTEPRDHFEVDVNPVSW